MQNVIGEGVYSKVRKDNTLNVAIKEFKRSYDWNAIQEIAILKHLENDNIIKLTSVNMDAKHRWIIFMKLCTFDLSTDWRAYFAAGMSAKFPILLFIEKILLDVSKAIDYMHLCLVIHGDLKPANILFDVVHCRAMVCDFNIALYNPSGTSSTRIQTPCYRAPEVDFDKEYGQFGYKIDIWSYGCIMYELLTKERFVSIDDNDSTKCACDAFGLPFYKTRTERYTILKKMRIEQAQERIIKRITLSGWKAINGLGGEPETSKYGKDCCKFVAAIIAIMRRCIIPYYKYRFNAVELFHSVRSHLQFNFPTDIVRVDNTPPLKPMSLTSSIDDNIIKSSIDDITENYLSTITKDPSVSAEFVNNVEWEKHLHNNVPKEFSNWLHLLEVNYYNKLNRKKIRGSREALLVSNACLRIISCISRNKLLKNFYSNQIELESVNQSAVGIIKALDYKLIY